MSDRIAVFGSSGFIGSAFRRSRDARFLLTARRKIERTVSFDPLTMSVASIPGIRECSHALILFAEREPDACAARPDTTRRVNVTLPIQVAEECGDLGIVPIFASSELVFDGATGLYDEESPALPILEYGRQKRAAEIALLKSNPDAMILRFPKTVGDIAADRSLFTNWVRDIQAGAQEIVCASDQYFSLAYVGDIPRLVMHLADLRISGVIHLGDGRRHSRLSLLELLLSQLRRVHVKPPDIHVQSIRVFDLPEPRPRDVSMATRRLRDVGILPVIDVEVVVANAVGSAFHGT